MIRVFARGPGDNGYIQGCVIPKTPKWCLTPRCLRLSILDTDQDYSEQSRD